MAKRELRKEFITRQGPCMGLSEADDCAGSEYWKMGKHKASLLDGSVSRGQCHLLRMLEASMTLTRRCENVGPRIRIVFRQVFQYQEHKNSAGAIAHKKLA
jgi:hypothetical protein